MNTGHKLHYLGIVLLLLLVSCKANRNSAEKPPRIIFLNYNLSKISDDEVHIEFINKIIVEGKLKQNLPNKSNPEFGDLKIIQNNAKSKAIQSIIITNPLIKDMEFADESGQLNRQMVELESTQVTIRMQLHPLAKFVVIERINKPNNRLIKSKL